jgi:hypothetical protein
LRLVIEEPSELDPGELPELEPRPRMELEDELLPRPLVLLPPPKVLPADRLVLVDVVGL